MRGPSSEGSVVGVESIFFSLNFSVPAGWEDSGNECAGLWDGQIWKVRVQSICIWWWSDCVVNWRFFGDYRITNPKCILFTRV